MPTVNDRPDDDARGKPDLVVWVNQWVHSPMKVIHFVSIVIRFWKTFKTSPRQI